MTAESLGPQAIAQAKSGRGRLGPWIVVFWGLLVGGLFVQPARAIDPSRRLVQSFHRIWQFQQGLPQATIYSIIQSSDGYLWLGTPSGVVRFDGVHFTVMREMGGVPLEKTQVLALLEDKQQNFWLGTDGGGLIRVRQGVAKRFTKADGLPSDSVQVLLADREGTLWIGTSRGVARLSGDKLTNFSADEGLLPGEVYALGLASDGSVWVGGDSAGVSIWDGSRFTIRRFNSLPDDSSVRALLGASHGGMWVGTNHGLMQVLKDSEQRWTVADDLADNFVYCLAAGSNDSLWIGTRQGFSRLHQGDIDSFHPQDGLSQSTAYAICEDHEGSLWVGTKHGLNQFVDRRTIPFTVREGLPSNDAGPILQDQSGEIWVGTLGAGLARYDGRNFTVVSIEQGLASNTITALATGAPDEQWVGTDRGLNRLDDAQVTSTYTTDHGLPSNSIRCLLRTSAGDFWAGTSAGLVLLRGDKFVAPVDASGPARQPISALAESHGQLLVATTAGNVFRYSGGNFEPLLPEAISARDIGAIFVDAAGLIWIGTQSSGLILVDGHRVAAFSTADGLYDDAIFGITSDDRGRLWMACSKGIFSVKRDDLLSFAAGRLQRFANLPISPTDGQRTIECRGDVQPSLWKMQDGRIWFSTIHGLIVLDPNNLTLPLPPAPVVVEEMIVNGTSRSPNDGAPLPRGANNISFRYTALSYRSPTRITFRYRLDGFDKDWVDAGTRHEAFYTNLAPGKYRFRVEARNVDERVSEAPAPIDFTLRPRIYQARWFLPVCLAVAAAAGWFAYRWRVRWIEARLQAIAIERSRIARELHDTLMQGFSGVTMEMQALLMRLPPSENRDTLDEIINDAGMCLREARRSIGGLRSTSGQESGLAASIAQTARQLTDSTDARLKLALPQSPSRLPASIEYDLLRIAQEALVNAVKHAQAGAIDVSLDYLPQSVRLTIQDDGVGFVPDVVSVAPGEHYGLMGMRERASQIGAKFSIESTPGRGTRVTVSLPVGTAAAYPERERVARGQLED